MTDPADTDLVETLREHGLRVTSPRLVLHRLLTEAGGHPTADEVLSLARRRLPALSAPTVYATLELFEDLGLVRKITIDGGAARFDPRPGGHHHLVCTECGAVHDVQAPVRVSAAGRAAEKSGAAVERVDVIVRGRCPACVGR